MRGEIIPFALLLLPFLKQRKEKGKKGSLLREGGEEKGGLSIFQSRGKKKWERSSVHTGSNCLSVDARKQRKREKKNQA